MYAGWLTVNVFLPLLFEKVPLGVNTALTECFPKKYALPPVCGVRVYVALLNANLAFVDVVGDSVSV